MLARNVEQPAGILEKEVMMVTDVGVEIGEYAFLGGEHRTTTSSRSPGVVTNHEICRGQSRRLLCAVLTNHFSLHRTVTLKLPRD